MVYDLIIIGAGQAGLAAGYYAKKARLNFIILDAGRPGDSWRRRYDSLVLFSLRRFCRLPGLALSGPADDYPTKDELADYLQRYAAHFELPVQTDTKVDQLTKASIFNLATGNGQMYSKSVIVATGGFQAPKIPPIPGWSSVAPQLTAAKYRRPSQLPPGVKVLVVGGGNSGAAIAAELASSHHVEWSVRRRPRIVSRRTAKLASYFLYWSGLIHLRHGSRLTKRLRSLKLPDINNELSLQILSGRVTLRPELKRLSGYEAIFYDGSKTHFDYIIWATGYRPDLSWIGLKDAVNTDGLPRHVGGLSPVPGLFYLGLEHQRSLGSSLVGGVGKDARFIVKQVQKYLSKQS